MDKPELKIAPGQGQVPGGETSSEKIRRLRAQIKEAASDELEELDSAIDQLCEIAQSIAQGGEAYPPGVREICRALAEEAAAQARSIDVILQRTGR